jgi:hypothetical protein
MQYRPSRWLVVYHSKTELRLTTYHAEEGGELGSQAGIKRNGSLHFGEWNLICKQKIQQDELVCSVVEEGVGVDVEMEVVVVDSWGADSPSAAALVGAGAASLLIKRADERHQTTVD